ncbi:hypothetical protein C5167_034235 [Papaver somniferum]|uniref:Uncharacterized protein n=1 Tax=Papaver somniferum TaxID=3469 RepID=A0A4Y7KC30_PAPSO|nr:hypothetical protein C5167_034235 [Papaver somniferum]
MKTLVINKWKLILPSQMTKNSSTSIAEELLYSWWKNMMQVGHLAANKLMKIDYVKLDAAVLKTLQKELVRKYYSSLSGVD